MKIFCPFHTKFSSQKILQECILSCKSRLCGERRQGRDGRAKASDSKGRLPAPAEPCGGFLPPKPAERQEYPARRSGIRPGGTDGGHSCKNLPSRSAEGIAQAKRAGVRFGRPMAPTPQDFPALVQRWQAGEITFRQALSASGLSESTFYRRLRQSRQAQAKAPQGQNLLT